MVWYLIALIFLVGLAGIVVEGNMVRKVVGLSIANSAITMLFVYFASRGGTTAPILNDAFPVDQSVPVDPLPHALMLTAIVVGICVVALALVLVYRLYSRFGTLDMPTIESRVWSSHDDGHDGNAPVRGGHDDDQDDGGLGDDERAADDGEGGS